MFLLIVNLGLPIRIYIGRSAAADARKKKKKSVIYIVLLTWYAIRLRIMRRELDKEGRRPYVA